MYFSIPLLASARVVKAVGSRLGRPAAGRQAISLTPAAIARIKELIGQRPGARALKVLLTFTYHWKMLT
jgi:hypothetical protein